MRRTVDLNLENKTKTETQTLNLATRAVMERMKAVEVLLAGKIYLIADEHYLLQNNNLDSLLSDCYCWLPVLRSKLLVTKTSDIITSLSLTGGSNQPELLAED